MTMRATTSSADLANPTDRSGRDNPLVIPDLSSARSLIHGALEFLCHYDAIPRVALDFHKAFGATDTLLDMEEALLSLERSDWPDDMGMTYLLAIGTLQALVAQQDAAQRLCEVFGVYFNPQKVPELLRIRDIRARAAGHPSLHGRNGRRPKKGEEAGSTFLVRRPFTKEKAPIVTYFDGPSGREPHDINLVQLYRSQNRILANVLRLVWVKIMVDYQSAAIFRWDPWQVRERYGAPGLSVVVS